MNKKQKVEKKQNKLIKKQRKEKITLQHLPSVTWKCTKCGRSNRILFNERNRHLYTEERKKTFVCVICK